MKIIDSAVAHTTASPDQVFALWANPEGWAAWDPEVSEVAFAGPAGLGSRGRMRPASGPAARFTVTEFEPDRVFTSASSLPGARLVFEHRVSPGEDGSRIEVAIGVTGPLAGLWSRALAGSLGNAARSSTHGLVAHLR